MCLWNNVLCLPESLEWAPDKAAAACCLLSNELPNSTAIWSKLKKDDKTGKFD